MSFLSVTGYDIYCVKEINKIEKKFMFDFWRELRISVLRTPREQVDCVMIMATLIGTVVIKLLMIIIII